MNNKQLFADLIQAAADTRAEFRMEVSTTGILLHAKAIRPQANVDRGLIVTRETSVWLDKNDPDPVRAFRQALAAVTQ